MSDILLSVGLQTGSAETSQIQSDLQRIISRIDKNPPKVKVGLTVDQSALNHFKSQLTQIVNSVGLSKGAPITVNISGLGEITAEAGNAKKALDGVSSAGKAAAESVNNMSGKKAADSLTQINNQIILMQANLAKWTAAQNGNASASYTAYSHQLTVLMELKTLVEQNAISTEDFAERLSRIKAAASDAAAAIKGMGEDHAAKSVEKLIKYSDAYNVALGKTENLLAQVKKRQIEWTAAKNGKASGAYADLDQYRIALESLIGKLMTGEMTAEQFAAAFSKISAKVKTAEGAIRSCGENTKTLGDRMKGLAEKFGAWLSVSQVIMMAVRAIKQMVVAVREVDTAMTELKKVTNETDATYIKFLDGASERAKRIGASISDVVTATADFARLGYSIEDASELADTAIVYKNIGDGIEDITEASESIISTMQAFGVEATNAMTIVDRFNKIGNSFAISSAGIGEAMQRSAAAMASANNTIDETIALITAANTIVQNPESVGTTMKTISMYLRAAKTEAEDAGESADGMANSVSELREEILHLTGQKVDIQLDEDTFKSTYQILKELSVVWDDLSDISQANILEMIGGKRNANVVSALLENFSIAEEALKSSMGAAGSALEENEKHLDSINGKVAVFKAAFEELSINLINSEFVKGIVDFGTTLIEILNVVAEVVNALGGLETVLLAIGGIILTMKIDGIIASVVSLATKIRTLTLFTGTFATKFASVYKTSRLFGATRLQSTLNGISTGFKAVAASASAAQIAVAAFTAAIVIISMLNSAIEQAEEATKASNDSLIATAEESAPAARNLYDLYDAYVQASQAAENDASAKAAVQSASEALAKALGVEQEAVDGLVTSYKNLTAEELKNAVSDAKIGVDAAEKNLINEITDFRDSTEETMMIMWGVTATGKDFTQAKTQAEKVEILVAAYNALVAEQRRLADAGETGSIGYTNISKTVALFGPYITKLEAAKNTLATVQEQYNNVINDIVGSTNNATDSTTGALNSLSNVFSDDTKDAIDDVQSRIKTLSDALTKLSDGTLDASAVTDLLQEFPELAKYTDLYADNFGNLGEGLRSLIKSSPDAVIASLRELANTSGMTSEAKDLINDLCVALERLANVSASEPLSQFEKFVDTLSRTDALDSGFSQLSSIFNDIKDAGDFDWSSILSNDFTQTFGGLGESYEKFMRTVANSPKDLSACRSAFNELATAYIANSGALDNVTESNRSATIAMLEQMGVTNAVAIVDGQLAINKERLKYTTSEYTNMTYAEVQALYNEAMAGSAAKQALAELAVQKYLEENTVIDSTSDIEQLLTLANAANATAESLARVNQAKAIMAQADSAYAQYQSEYRGGDPNQLASYRRYLELKNQANSILSTPIEYETINPADLIVDFEGVSSAASNAKNDIESLYDSAKNGIEELIDYRKKMLEQDIENQKDALEAQIDELQDFYDEQREMLEEQYDEEEFLAEQHEKQKAVTDLKGELAMLQNDDSAWAQRRKLEIKEELSEAEDELSELEKEHALDVTLDMLDDQQEAQEKQIQDQIDALDAKLNDPHALYNQALSDIRNNTLDLYQEMIEFNRRYGSGNDDDVADMWNDAYESNEDYRDKTGSTYKDIELGDYANYNASGVGRVSDVSATLRKGSTGDGVRALQHALNQLGYGNSGTKSLDGSFGSGTRSAVIAFQRAMGLSGDGVVGSATKAKFKSLGYAVGTANATPGIHEVDEFGAEYVFVSPSDGTRYRMFHGGEKVLTAEATDFLYQFANSGGSILTKMISDLLKYSGLGNISKPIQAIEVNAGDVIVHGNASAQTVSEIRRAQRNNLEFVLKELNKLNK